MYYSEYNNAPRLPEETFVETVNILYISNIGILDIDNMSIVQRARIRSDYRLILEIELICNFWERSIGTL